MNKNNFQKLYNYCKSLGYPSSESEFYEELQHFIVNELDSRELENISGGTSLKNKFCASVLSALSVLSAGSSVGAVNSFEYKNSNFSSKAASCSWLSKHKEAVISALLGIGGGAALVSVPTAGVISHLYKQKNYFNDMDLNDIDLKNIPQETKNYINSLMQYVTTRIYLETVNFENSDLWEAYQKVLNSHNNDVDEAFNAEFGGLLKSYTLKEAHPELKKFLVFTRVVAKKLFSSLGDINNSSILNCMYCGWYCGLNKAKLNVLARKGDLDEFNEFLAYKICDEHSLSYYEIFKKSSSWMKLNKAPQMFVPANDEATEVKLIDFKIEYLDPANRSNLPPEVAELVDLFKDETKYTKYVAFFNNINKKYLGLSIPEEPQPSEN